VKINFVDDNYVDDRYDGPGYIVCQAFLIICFGVRQPCCRNARTASDMPLNVGSTFIPLWRYRRPDALFYQLFAGFELPAQNNKKVGCNRLDLLEFVGIISFSAGAKTNLLVLPDSAVDYRGKKYPPKKRRVYNLNTPRRPPPLITHY